MRHRTRENPKVLSSLCDAFVFYCREKKIIAPPLLPVSEIIVHIADNIGREITVAELSRRIGYNPQYFIRLFKEAMGVTPHQYIINYRLREARKAAEK